MTYHPDPQRNLAKETAAAKVLRDALLAITDDPIAVADTIEGETDLNAAIAVVMDSMREDEILLTGLEGTIEALEARKHRIERRIERQREAVEQAMIAGEIKTLTLPECTLSLRNVQGKAVVLNSELIPSNFWKLAPPILMKDELNKALKAGEQIPGAVLSNGSVSLAIRKG